MQTPSSDLNVPRATIDVQTAQVNRFIHTNIVIHEEIDLGGVSVKELCPVWVPWNGWPV